MGIRLAIHSGTHLFHHSETAIQSDEKVTLVVPRVHERAFGIEVGECQSGSIQRYPHFVEDFDELP